MLDPGITRDGARDLAHRELLDHRYDQAKPSLLTRLVHKVIHALSDGLDSAGAHTPGGVAGVVVVLLLLVGLVVLLVVRLRVASSAGAAGGAVFSGGQALTADQHRTLADGFAADGAYDEAVRERLRAIVRQLESRGVLDPRPGRTALEVAAEAGRLVAALREPLQQAAVVFDEVWYGGRTADATAYRQMVDVDALVAGTRAVVA